MCSLPVFSDAQDSRHGLGRQAVVTTLSDRSMITKARFLRGGNDDQA